MAEDVRRHGPFCVGIRVNMDRLTEINDGEESFTAMYFFHFFVDIKGMHLPRKKNAWKLMEKIRQRLDVENCYSTCDGEGDDGIKKPSINPKAEPGAELPRDSDLKEEIRIEWKLSGKFGESLELQSFPFDSQELNVWLRIGIPIIRAGHEDMSFFLEDSGQSKVCLHVFTLKNTWVKPQYVDVRLTTTKASHNSKQDQFYLLKVTAVATRRPFYYVLNIVTPMFSIALMSGAAVFIHKGDVGDRLSASLTLILTAVAYKYIVAQMVPRIGYNTILDWYILGCWLFLFVMVIENCFYSINWVRDTCPEVVTISLLGGAFGLFNIIWCVCAYSAKKRAEEKNDKRKCIEAERRRLNYWDPITDGEDDESSSDE
eukprot:TRINITY_DN20908_c0_g1_i1.p1 TRINITY_DN20908_c0_g1~~TRINITY_DN20908_c0_g1_i1.p1  ORF type:complete len:402 (-),score=63.49 TRINITY_DN20908_c0_g1_i1:92-1207(-)